MKKRGLSNLVATVLIVLLALAAVAIIWGFIGPALKNSGLQTELRTRCFSIDIQPISCSYTNVSDSVKNVTLQARLLDGEVDEFGVAIEFPDGSTELSDESFTAPGVLETRVVTFTFDDPDESVEEVLLARVAPIVSEGTVEEYCQESVSIDCSYDGN